MLRKAVELGGFHRAYFIAHQRDLWDLADAQLIVEGGKVRIGGESAATPADVGRAEVDAA